MLLSLENVVLTRVSLRSKGIGFDWWGAAFGDAYLPALVLFCLPAGRGRKSVGAGRLKGLRQANHSQRKSAKIRRTLCLFSLVPRHAVSVDEPTVTQETGR